MSKLLSIELTQIVEPLDPARHSIEREKIEELAASMKTVGLIQPIVVIPCLAGYEIEAGHRRYLAAKLLNWETIQALIPDDAAGTPPHLARAHENLIRENLNPVEEAAQVDLLVNEQNRGTEETAKLLCKTTTWVENRLDILQYPDVLKAALSNGKINMTVARQLARCQNADDLNRYLDTAIAYGASAPTVRQWVTDSQTMSDIEHREQQSDASTMQSADMGDLKMRCGIDGELYDMAKMRHLWLCPDCMIAMVQVASQTQSEQKDIHAQRENTATEPEH